jgi:hypothetical protein
MLFGTLVAETILASVHVRTHQQKLWGVKRSQVKFTRYAPTTAIHSEFGVVGQLGRYSSPLRAEYTIATVRKADGVSDATAG